MKVPLPVAFRGESNRKSHTLFVRSSMLPLCTSRLQERGALWDWGSAMPSSTGRDITSPSHHHQHGADQSFLSAHSSDTGTHGWKDCLQKRWAWTHHGSVGMLEMQDGSPGLWRWHLTSLPHQPCVKCLHVSSFLLPGSPAWKSHWPTISLCRELLPTL